jgi:hypothetical protein
MADVEAKVHLLEGAVSRDPDAQHVCICEEKSNEADVDPTGPSIQLDAGRKERFEERLRGLVVEHHEVFPTRAEERRPANRRGGPGVIHGGGGAGASRRLLGCGSRRPIIEHSTRVQRAPGKA